MSRLLAWLRGFAAYEPALAGWLVNGGLAVTLAFAFHLTRVEEGAVATIVTAAVGLYVAFRARPVSVAVVTGFFATVATALAAFHFRVSPDALAMADAIAAFVIPLIFRPGTRSTAYLRDIERRRAIPPKPAREAAM